MACFLITEISHLDISSSVDISSRAYARKERYLTYVIFVFL